MFKKFISGEVVIVLNNLGATTPLEMSQLSLDILREAHALQWQVRVMIEGTLMSSLNMHGVSITVLPATPRVLQYLMMPTTAPAW